LDPLARPWVAGVVAEEEEAEVLVQARARARV